MAMDIIARAMAAHAAFFTGSTGEAFGPNGATPDNIVIFDGNTGSILKDSGKRITDFVYKNTDISPSTNTKISYDSNGLITGSTNATTLDINPSTNRNYITDSQVTNLSGLTSNVQAQINIEILNRITGDTINYNLITGLTTTINSNYIILNNNITGETANRLSGDISNYNLITGETINRAAQDIILNNLITGETQNRIISEANKVNRTGDTMTGTLYVQKTGSTNSDLIYGGLNISGGLTFGVDGNGGFTGTTSNVGSSSNYISINSSGLQKYVGSSSGISYGSMYIEDVNSIITLPLANTYYPILSGFTSGMTQNSTFQNNREIKITTPGVYKVDWSLSMSSNGSDRTIAGVILGGQSGTTVQSQTENAVRVVDGGVVLSLSGTGIMRCSANDLIRIGLENETDANATITCSHSNLTIIQIGG